MTKTSGGQGFADVWWRGKFAWEYKGRHKDLGAAFARSGSTVRLADGCAATGYMTPTSACRFEFARWSPRSGTGVPFHLA